MPQSWPSTTATLQVDPNAILRQYGGGFSDLLTRLPAGHNDVLVAGTTGEFPALSRNERSVLTRLAVQVVGAEPVIAHLGAASLDEANRLTEDAIAAGVTRLALLIAYYLPANEQQVIEHFQTFAGRHEQLQIYAYLLPERIGVTVGSEAITQLVEPANIVCAKLSGRANEDFFRFRSLLLDDQDLYTVTIPDRYDPGRAGSRGRLGRLRGGARSDAGRN